MRLLPDSAADSVIGLTARIQQIAAPTFHESMRAQFAAEQMQIAGLVDVHQDDTGNVLGRLPGGNARPLVISAHLDTVHPENADLSLQYKRDRIIGRAIGDNSLGLAALLALPSILRAGDFRPGGDLWFVANVCEEGLGNLIGMRAIVDRFGAQPLGYVVIEGMGFGNVLHRGLGVERYRITVKTNGGHSWVDYGRASAIHSICELVTRLTAIALPLTPVTTLNVGVISGGTTINTIAAQASLELDLRSEESGALRTLVNQTTALVDALRTEEVRIEMGRIGKRESGAIASETPLVQLVCGILHELGQKPRLGIGSTDANVPLSRGYAAVCIGITHGANAHSAEEYILTAPVARGLTQLVTIIRRAWETT